MYRRNTSLAIISLMIFVLSACNHKAGEENKPLADSASLAEAEEMAKNDIAMTVRSMASSIEAGEPLDSSVYNFNGCLTDGRGVPLYTDSYNRPGTWSVKVKSPDEAVIRNLYPGDLFPDDLRLYIVSAMNLADDDITTPDEEEEETTDEGITYNFGPGLLRFETVNVEAPDGSPAPVVSIYISRHES